MRARFNEALEGAVKEIEAAPEEDRNRLFKSLGVNDLEGFKACMRFDFEESPNLPIDVGNEVVQFLEDLEIRRELNMATLEDTKIDFARKLKTEAHKIRSEAIPHLLGKQVIHNAYNAAGQAPDRSVYAIVVTLSEKALSYKVTATPNGAWCRAAEVASGLINYKGTDRQVELWYRIDLVDGEEQEPRYFWQLVSRGSWNA